VPIFIKFEVPSILGLCEQKIKVPIILNFELMVGFAIIWVVFALIWVVWLVSCFSIMHKVFSNLKVKENIAILKSKRQIHRN